MSPSDFLFLLPEGLFPLLAVFALIDFIRHRDWARLDIALMFGVLAVVGVSRILTNLLVPPLAGLEMLTWVALLVHPFFLLRLIRHFRSVRPYFQYLALVGWLASSLILYLHPFIPGVNTLIALIYFVLAELYATVAFLRGARTTGGVTRQRLTLAAAGTAFVAASIVTSIGLSRANLLDRYSPVVLLLSVLAAIMYFYGFMTPAWLRRTWQLSELQRFLTEMAGKPAAERAPETLAMLCRAATRSVGALGAAVFLWDEKQKRLVLRDSNLEALPLSTLKADTGAIGEVWRAQEGQLIRTLASLGDDAEMASLAIGAKSLYLVPIATAARRWGLVLVFQFAEPLFAADDLDLLALLADQSAHALDYSALLDEQHNLLEQVRQAHEDERNVFFTLSIDMLAIASFDGYFKRLNPTWTKTLGFTEAELCEKPLIERVHPDDRELMRTEMQKLTAGVETVSVENRYLCHDGSYKWLTWNIAPLVERQLLYAVVHDFSARREAEHEIRSRADQFAALYETAQALATQQDLQPLLQTIVERAVTLLGAAGGSISLYESIQQYLEVVVTKGPELPVGERFKLGEGLTGRVAQAMEPMIVEDYRTWKYRAPQFSDIPISASIQVPMQYRGELIGVLAVNEVGNTTRKFTEADTRLLSLLAGQAAGAVHNTRLFEETRARAEQLALLYDAGLALNRVREPRAQLTLLLQVGMKALRSDSAEFFRLDLKQNTMRFELGAGQDEEMNAILHRLNFRIGDPVGVVGWVGQNRQPVNIYDLSSDPRYLTLDSRLRAGLWVPVEHENQLRGVLAMFRMDSQPFTPHEEQLLCLFAHQAAVALENARLFAETERRLQEFHALSDIQHTISSSLDLHATLRVLLDQVTAQLRVDAADVLLLNQHTLTLEFTASRGFHSPVHEHTALRLGEGLAGVAALERQTVSIPNLRSADHGANEVPSLHGEGFAAYYGVPLVAKGKVKGVLEMFHRAPLEPDQEWLEFAQVLAAQAAIAIDDAELFQNLQRSNIDLMLGYDATIEGWSRALELRDRETQGHTARVTEMTLRLARALGVGEAELVHIRRGALLHDMGKMGIPDSILLKPAPLSREEVEVMRRHPEYAYAMLAPITYLHPALDIPYCHHEKWDGSGYPRGLKKDQIPLAARIFAVIDVWDALRSDRPYRPAWEETRVRAYLQDMSGQHFDPEVVRVFLEQVIDGTPRRLKG